MKCAVFISNHGARLLSISVVSVVAVAETIHASSSPQLFKKSLCYLSFYYYYYYYYYYYNTKLILVNCSKLNESCIMHNQPHLQSLLPLFAQFLPQKLSPKCNLFKNILFNKLCVHKQSYQCGCSRVETLVMLRAKFHVVSRLLTVLKIQIFMLL